MHPNEVNQALICLIHFISVGSCDVRGNIGVRGFIELMEYLKLLLSASSQPKPKFPLLDICFSKTYAS